MSLKSHSNARKNRWVKKWVAPSMSQKGQLWCLSWWFCLLSWDNSDRCGIFWLGWLMDVGRYEGVAPSMWAFPAWFWWMSGSCAIYVPKRQLDVEKKKWGETSAVPMAQLPHISRHPSTNLTRICHIDQSYPKTEGKTTRKDIRVVPGQEAKPPGKTSELSLFGTSMAQLPSFCQQRSRRLKPNFNKWPEEPFLDGKNGSSDHLLKLGFKASRPLLAQNNFRHFAKIRLGMPT